MKVFCTDFHLLIGKDPLERPLMDSLYLRGDNTLLNSGKRVLITSWMRGLSYMPQLVVRVARAGKGFEPRFAGRYYREAAIGLALADRQLLGERLRGEMDPALAYSFDGSLALAHFLPLEDLSGASLSILESDGAMLLDEPLESLSLPSRERIDEVVSGVAQLFLLKTGDCLCFPLWSCYRALERGRHLFVAEGDQELLSIGIE